MPLTPDEIPVPLTEGIDTYSDPKQARLLGVCKNMYVERGGELTTRPGLDEWSTTERTQGNERNYSTILEKGVALTEFNGKPLLVGRDGYYRTVNGVQFVQDARSGCGVYVPAEDGHYNVPWAVIGESHHFGVTHGYGPEPCGQEDVYHFPHHAVSGDYEIFVYPKSTVTNTWLYAIRNTVTGAWIAIHDGAAIGGVWTAVYGVVTVDFDSTPANGERFLIVAEAGGLRRIISVTPDTGAKTSAAIANLNADVPGCVCPALEGTQKVALIVGVDGASGKIRLVKAQGDTTSLVRDYDTAVTAQGPNYTELVTTSHGDDAYIFVFEWHLNAGSGGYLHAFPINYSSGQAALDSQGLWFSLIGNESRCGCIVAGYHQDLGMTVGTGTHTIKVIMGAAEGAGGANQYQQMTYIAEANFHSGTNTLTQITSAPRILRNMLPAAQPIIMDNKIFLPVTFQGSNASQEATQYIHNSLHLMELRRPTAGSGDGDVCHHMVAIRGYDVARTTPDDGTAMAAGLPLSHYDGTTIHVPYLRQTRLNASTLESEPMWQQAVAAVAKITEAAPPPQFVRSGSDLIMGGGVVRHIDGACQELGFWEPMEIFDFVDGGAGTINGVVSIRQIAEWVDRFGQTHTSAPSDARTKSVVAKLVLTAYTVDPNHYQCVAAYHQSGAKFGGADLTLFRTQADGSTHLRWVHAGNPDDGLANGYLQVSSLLTDADIANQEPLYTDAGILPNDPPPGSNILLAHKNRVFIVPAEQSDTIWPSKPRLPGVGLSFNADTAITIFDDGDITGLGSVDDYVVVFKQKAIYVFGGEGPTVTGSGGFSTPQRISSSVGCRDPNSVVSFDGGVLFKSNSGWHILDRSLGLVPAGLPVKDWDSYTVYRAALLPSLRQIRIVHDPDDTHDVLVYDYLNQAWTVINYDDAQGASFGPVDTAEIGGEVMVLGADGRSFREIIEEPYDDNEEQPFDIEVKTPWVSNQLHDVQRIWKIKFVGEWGDEGGGTVYVKIYHDFSDSETETQTINTISIGSDGVFWVKPNRAVCKAVRIGLSGYIRRISAITLKVGKRPGRVGRTPALTVS